MNQALTKGEIFKHTRDFMVTLKMEYNTEFYVVLYTSLGKIVCDIEPPAAQNSLIGFTDDPTMFTIDISAIFDGKGLFDAELINARNVTIYKNNTDEEVARLDQMIIFTDQILGFTFIKK